ncbi:LacI family DNA-binding transcriptional regulator [Caloramator proteoclasticus]|uniref:DNA-binding transcriptional regulator, LacI/PurR family n=1 Tax=Caloramator proteoclasticus DSM 10124 TaxID=1121262 RepID=A0A1M5ACM3_9CLOT|nr:LacI family DNA-binding transcriptional regulator [Caloramator proteoclasticus]SHF27935.1 DNA-binding transcriptional regulator, LacI/PurR family [Caloramator proteoclasticus DSM 10124]
MKRPTLKDIAKEVGVSVATVSYVLNGNEKQSISEETKDKIIQAANRLNYVPNLAARSLVKRKSGLVGVLILKHKQNKMPIFTNHNYKLLEKIEEYLATKGYHVLSSNISVEEPNLDIIKQRDLDGVLVFNVDNRIFYDISIKFTVPILLIDAVLDDILFHKINVDYLGYARKVSSEDKKVILIPHLNSEHLMDKIREDKRENEEVYFISSVDSVREVVKKHRDERFIVVSEELGVILSRFVEKDRISVICINNEDYLLDEQINKIEVDIENKAKLISDLLLRYIDKNYKYVQYTIIEAE